MTSPNNKKRILIIEDDAIVGAVYRGLLSNRGYEAQLETTGRLGLDRMTDFKPDAVLLDLMLPESNGLEVLKEIRSLKDFSAIPVLVFTNAYVPTLLDSARTMGANYVFSKSTLTSRQLLEALSQCVPGAPDLNSSSTQSGNTTSLGRDATSAATDYTKTRIIHIPVTPTNQDAGDSAATEFLSKRRAKAPMVLGSKSTGNLSVGSSGVESQTQEIRAEFIKTVGPSVSQLRYALSELAKPGNDSGQGNLLVELHRQVRTFGSNAGFAGFRPPADLCSALELLVAELIEKPRMFNPSILRTMVNTLDVLNDLVIKRVEVDLLYDPSPSILVVDDEVLSRRAVTFALEKGRLKALECSDPKEALHATSRTHFDLIFLDVQMPTLNGFELCTQIRAQITNQRTPVIFVTSMSDFKSRVRSTISGATDLIAKPFLFFELTVKAVSTLLQVRSEKIDRRSAAA